jgi:hypothetical protein
MRIVLLLTGLLAALPAAAQQSPALRPLCASRPGLGTPPCIIDKGHLQAEVGIVAVQYDDSDALSTDIVALGTTELTYGIDGFNQISVIIAPFNIITITEQVTDRSRRIMGLGDISLRWRHSLRHPDGEGVSIAFEAFANVAIGGPDIRSNAWGAGLLVPLSVPITGSLSFITAPGFVVSENSARPGVHVDYTGSLGLAQALGAFTLTAEWGYTRNGDPDNRQESTTASAALAWSPPRNANLQFDVGVALATNAPAPDIQAYIGVVKRF